MKNQELKKPFAKIDELIAKNAPDAAFEEIPAAVKVDYMRQHADEEYWARMLCLIEFGDIEKIADDEEKAKCLITLYALTGDHFYLETTSLLTDDFYKMKMRELVDAPKGRMEIVDEFEQKSADYQAVLAKTAGMTEEEKYEFASSLSDKDLQTLFFYQTQDLSCRQKIIDGMKENIEPALQEPAHLAQEMIMDFFEETAGEKFTQKEQQELAMIFKRTEVAYDPELPDGINGVMRHTNYQLKMNPRRDNPQEVLMYLLHEYGHAISLKHFKTADYENSKIRMVEEGMSDTFADLVMQSYQKAHGNVTLGGQEIDLAGATILARSGYKSENECVRMMLYPLEASRRGQGGRLLLLFGAARRAFLRSRSATSTRRSYRPILTKTRCIRILRWTMFTKTTKRRFFHFARIACT